MGGKRYQVLGYSLKDHRGRLSEYREHKSRQSEINYQRHDKSKDWMHAPREGYCNGNLFADVVSVVPTKPEMQATKDGDDNARDDLILLSRIGKAQPTLLFSLLLKEE